MADNPDEIFDIVDAGDRVIGTARREDVHRNGWLHRAVHIIVRRGNGDVFLQKRSMEKDSHPGKWDSSASGHLDSGEDYMPAAVRELHEELGVPGAILNEVGALDACDETGQEYVRIYQVHHEGPFSLHPTEIETGRWLSVAELESWIADNPQDFAPCFLYIWQHIGRSLPA